MELARLTVSEENEHELLGSKIWYCDGILEFSIFFLGWVLALDIKVWRSKE